MFITNTKNKKKVEVILTAKKYHLLMVVHITLDEWFKSDMFVTNLEEVQKYKLQYFQYYSFKNYLKLYNKRVWNLYKDDKTDCLSLIVQKGLDLKIDYVDNYSCLEKYQDDYNDFYNNEWKYKKNRIIKFLRNKLAKCKK
jgi:hypothetical protein